MGYDVSTTAQCDNPDCSEFEVPKDMQFLPPGYTDPVFCGVCGDVIDVSGVTPNETTPTPHK